MLIGVISDTHGSFLAWERSLAGPFSDVDKIVHAGDVFYHGTRNPMPEGYDTLQLAEAINRCELPVAIAMGNCDSEVDQMVCNVPMVHPFLVIEEQGMRIMIQHWQRGGTAELQDLITRFRPGVFITGHTHVPEIHREMGTLVLNPGSPSLTKRADGTRTVARLQLAADGTVRALMLDVESGLVLEEVKL